MTMPPAAYMFTIFFSIIASSTSFIPKPNHQILPQSRKTPMTILSSATSSSSSSSSTIDKLYNPTSRDAAYGPNMARYLLELHDNRATFDFCGGMMFQLVLTDKLRRHLTTVADGDSNAQQQPVIYESSKSRMFAIPGYDQSASADNVRVFHGREIRKVPGAAGGFGFVLQLSHSSTDNDGDLDPDGWTKEEIAGYDGWKHDVSRVWRNGDMLVKEGNVNFKNEFGEKAFTLNHRFYLHYDEEGRMWLSAEDGCEGTPSKPKNMMDNIGELFGMGGK